MPFAPVMNDKKGAIDIVNEILEACILAYPISPFVISLYQQYQQRGSLSKKQLEGLYGKASKIQSLPPSKLATLEARIKSMPTRFKSGKPETAPVYQKEESTGTLIAAILERYPQHKQVLFLKSKYENRQALSATEMNELKRFSQLLK